MNISITGATGLVGSHLANYYLNLGWDVYALVKDESSASILNKRVNRVYGNVNNKQDVDYFIQRSLPDYFVHLAAQTQAYDSLKYPYQTFYTNLIGTLNIVESLKEYSSCKSILIASSDKAYGELTSKEYKEDHPINGIYPYDASKSATEIISMSYKKTYNMPIAITRCCNIYGINDTNQERLITGIVSCYVNNSTFSIRNNGEDVREYIHVNDVVSAYSHILDFIQSDVSIDAFNVSSGERFKTIEIFNKIQDIIGKPVKHNIINMQNLEIKKQFMNSDLLKEKTGWAPKHKMSDSLKDVIDWYIDIFNKA
jgi:CDP-glucose 4,6-dehydratase